MATKKQLRDRWHVSPGRTILTSIDSLGIINPGHGHKSEEIFALLTDLPFRHEVANGRDFRGASMAGRELDFRQCDFSFGQVSHFYYCDLTGSKFDGCTSERASIHKKVNECSFFKAKLRSCYLCDAELRYCNFNDAQLTGCSFKNSDLTGSSFRNADCHRAAFANSCLVGCDFREANLEEAVLLDVKMDKSTDIRGASLVNIYNETQFDTNGNVVARGADWRQCKFDLTTRFGRDQEKLDAEIKESVLAVLSDRADPVSERLRAIIEEKWVGAHDWQEKVAAQLDENDGRYWDSVLDEAFKRLL